MAALSGEAALLMPGYYDRDCPVAPSDFDRLIYRGTALLRPHYHGETLLYHSKAIRKFGRLRVKDSRYVPPYSGRLFAVLSINDDIRTTMGLRAH